MTDTTTTNPFERATKVGTRARVALVAPAGAGKTYTALLWGTRLAERAGGRLAVIDTEHRTSAKYADLFDFDALYLDTFSPSDYIEAIHAAGANGYGALTIDSLSHAWSGTDGALEQVDRAKARHHGSSFSAWRDVTPLHNQLVEAILSAPCHVIATMRAKQHYAIDEVEENGRKKTEITRLGLAPVQREGVEYEFDIVGDLDLDHRLVVTKSRCFELADAVIPKPGIEVADVIADWLSGSIEAPKPISHEQRAELTALLAGLADEEKDSIRRVWPIGVPPLSRPTFNSDHYDKVRALVSTLVDPLSGLDELAGDEPAAERGDEFEVGDANRPIDPDPADDPAEKTSKRSGK